MTPGRAYIQILAALVFTQRQWNDFGVGIDTQSHSLAMVG